MLVHSGNPCFELSRRHGSKIVSVAHSVKPLMIESRQEGQMQNIKMVIYACLYVLVSSEEKEVSIHADGELEGGEYEGTQYHAETRLEVRFSECNIGGYRYAAYKLTFHRQREAFTTNLCTSSLRCNSP